MRVTKSIATGRIYLGQNDEGISDETMLNNVSTIRIDLSDVTFVNMTKEQFEQEMAAQVAVDFEEQP